MKISFKVNGKSYCVDVDPLKRLLDVLRKDLKLTGTKEGCGEGECGACTVMINGNLALACLTPISQVEGAEILTIEGLAKEGKLSYVQEAFVENGAVQCGFCTPGFAISTHHYIKNGGSLNDDAIRHALSGNFCRCTGYQKIIDGVKAAFKKHQDQGEV